VPHTGLLDAFDGFLIDLDGVIYVGDRLVPGADTAVRTLRARDKGLVFLTNDPRSSREHYAAKLRRLGIDAEASDVLTSGAATAEYIRRYERTDNRSAFVVGSEAFKSEVRSVGLTVIEGEEGRFADLVVVGGHDGFGFAELRVASQAVMRGAAFYGAGRDGSFPMPDGPWPATGAILAAVETASGRRAHVIGKPEPEMFGVAQELLPGRERFVVVGDRLDSDIAGGRRAGLATVLVLSGSTTELEAAEAVPAPDFVIGSVGDLARCG